MLTIEHIVDSIMLDDFDFSDDYDSILDDNLLLTGNMVNLGRDRSIINRAQTAMYSALMDNRTCPLCADLDGTYVKVGSNEYSDYAPPLHNRCRCIWVYIGDESTMPEGNFRAPSAELIKKHGNLIGNKFVNNKGVKAYTPIDISSLAQLNAGNKITVEKDTSIKVKKTDTDTETINIEDIDINGEIDVIIPQGTTLKAPFKIKYIGNNLAKLV